jgi:4-hydroxybenzoate polyprenyltransferase
MSIAKPTFAQVVGNYLSLIKFSHTIFALPFALIGFTLAVQHEGAQQIAWGRLLILVLLCMVFARSAAMAFNRYLDRHFDALNPRTAKREVPAGIVSSAQALLFTIATSLAFVVTTWFINPLCFYLSFVALFVVLFYSYTKRFTPLCHLVLGVGLALAPLGAYLAVTGEFSLLPILFSLVVFTWVSGFDIIYALQDESFDKANNLYSIPAALGAVRALWVSTLLHVLSACAVVAAGLYGHFSLLYWLGAVFYMAMLVYQHLLVKPNDLSKVNIAFGNTNGVASVIFALLTIASILMGY